LLLFQPPFANSRNNQSLDADLRRTLNAMKHDQFPWMLEVTKNAPRMAIIHMG